MFFAKGAMLLLATFLENPFIKRDHPPLGGVSQLSAVLGTIYNLIGWVGFINMLKGFKELSDTLQYCGSTELILVLPALRNHPEDVACYIHVIKGSYTTFIGFTAFEE